MRGTELGEVITIGLTGGALIMSGVSFYEIQQVQPRIEQFSSPPSSEIAQDLDLAILDLNNMDRALLNLPAGVFLSEYNQRNMHREVEEALGIVKKYNIENTSRLTQIADTLENPAPVGTSEALPILSNLALEVSDIHVNGENLQKSRHERLETALNQVWGLSFIFYTGCGAAIISVYGFLESRFFRHNSFNPQLDKNSGLWENILQKRG